MRSSTSLHRYRDKLLQGLADEARSARFEVDGARVPTGKPRLAILPFANLSSDPDNEFLSEGIAEDLLNSLTRNR